jgi:hypothetical protein
MRPLVVGPPRSGFALLCSVLSELLPMDPPRLDLRQRLIAAAVRHLQFSVSRAIEATFAAAGVGDDLVFNANFRTVTGGPKWLKEDDPARACIRKYLGVRGKGDFTLVVAHPAQVLETDGLVHSHSQPRLWTELTRYREFVKFASVRNPVGIVNSALFSINALASEYIQRFLDPRDDNDELRQRLALYKFTDLDFFTGIVRHYKRYFDEFLPAAGRYHVMRWEDLIERPAETIGAIAGHCGLSVEPEHALQIWRRLDHVNLTGAHKHNFRRGKGIVGDWRRWMTNRHLDIIRDHGLEETMHAFGYGPLEPLDEAAYTPFQRQLAELLASHRVFDDYGDQDLFGFAFNKSNLESSAFAFRRYDWRAHTRIERSSFVDERILMAVWDAAEAAAAELNAVLDAVIAGRYATEEETRASLAAIARVMSPVARRMPKACAALEEEFAAIVEGAFADGVGDRPVVDTYASPRLIRAWQDYNIVSYRGRFSAIPHAAGPLDLSERAPETIPGALVRESYSMLCKALEGLEQR